MSRKKPERPVYHRPHKDECSFCMRAKVEAAEHNQRVVEGWLQKERAAHARTRRALRIAVKALDTMAQTADPHDLRMLEEALKRVEAARRGK